MRGGLPWGALALLAAGLGALAWAAPPRAQGARPAPSLAYAFHVFGGLLPLDRTLAEQEWHPWPWQGLDCTVVVVALGDGAPAAPPTRGRDAAGPRDTFGGDWTPTPAPATAMLDGAWLEPLDLCAEPIGEALAARLARALARPGAWVAREGCCQDWLMSVYAPADRLAARIRFGD